MELLLISENKIKISLTKEDLDGYSITADGIDYDNTETRRVFWTLLDEAKRQTGFDAAKNRIFIQIYPGKDGGCELYVSKIKHSEREDGIQLNVLKGILEKGKREKRAGPSVYRFDDVSGLLLACRRLRALGYGKGASAYSEEKRQFYLSFDASENDFSFIGEYGEAQNDAYSVLLYINEHCKCICDGDAVERLGNL